MTEVRQEPLSVLPQLWSSRSHQATVLRPYGDLCLLVRGTGLTASGAQGSLLSVSGNTGPRPTAFRAGAPPPLVLSDPSALFQLKNTGSLLSGVQAWWVLGWTLGWRLHRAGS